MKNGGFESYQKWNLNLIAKLRLTDRIIFESYQKWNLNFSTQSSDAQYGAELNLNRVEAIERSYMDAGTAT